MENFELPEVLKDTSSVQPRFQDAAVDERYLGAFSLIMRLGSLADEAPPYGSNARDNYLRELIRKDIEPILTGAISSMLNRFLSLGWKVTGGRNKARRTHEMLSQAEDGKGWDVFLSKVLEDRLTTDRGAFVELGTKGPSGPVVGLYHLDATRCTLTGNPAWPVLYCPAVGTNTGKEVPLDRDHVVHLPSMPDPDETHFNLGLSPVSIALDAAEVLKAINDYDIEKLRNLPPQGLMTISNITKKQWDDAVAEFELSKHRKEQAIFSALMVLAGQDLTRSPQIEIHPFSTLPDHFDKKITVEIYVKTLALALGVDVAEIWQIEHTGATKASVTVQHHKALGKGIGVVISAVERAINYHAVPRGTVFKFDLPDDEQDMAQAEIAGKRIDNVKKMYETDRMDSVSLIDREEGRQLLVQQGVLPLEFGETPVVTVEDIASHEIKRMKELLEPELLEPWDEIITIDQDGNLDGPVFKVADVWPVAVLKEVETEEEPPAPSVWERVKQAVGLGEKSHQPVEVEKICPICGEIGAYLYPEHKGLLVCRNKSCGITFDPEVE